MSRLGAVSLSSLALIFALSYPALAKTEKEFVSDAIKGDNSEIALGHLAVTKGGDPSVSAFGQTLIDDHTKNKTEAAALATQLGVSAPTGMTSDAQQEMAKLDKLSGSQFDKEFSQFMVKDHEKDISEFKKEASNGHSSVQQFASQSLPTLEKHLQEAKNLQSAKK